MIREVIPLDNYTKNANPTNSASHIIDEKVKLIKKSCDVNINREIIGAFIMIETDRDHNETREITLYTGFIEPQTLINNARNYRKDVRSRQSEVSFFECVSVGENYFGTKDVTKEWNDYLDDAERLKELF